MGAPIRLEGVGVIEISKTGYSLVIKTADDLRELLPEIADAGFRGIEPTFLTGAYPAPEDHIGLAHELVRICGDLGLEIPSKRGGRVPWHTIPSNDAGERASALDHVRKACESLSIMGGSILLIVPGERIQSVDYHTHWQRVVSFARAAGAIATEYGIRIGLENVEARFPVSETDWCKLIDDIGAESVAMYFDVGNVVWLGFGYPDHWIRTLGKRIIQIHFKDALYRLDRGTLHSELRHIRDGEVDWPGVMTALSEISYDGWIFVEPDGLDHRPSRSPGKIYADLRTILDADYIASRQ